MTTTRYWINRLAQSFGYIRKNSRMSDAASEMHLLREAEAFLGLHIWENVEPIEALSVEYWNLRKLVKERDIAKEKLASCEENLRLAHEERAALLNSMPEFDQSLLDERNSLLAGLEELAKQRDAVVANAREVRRAYVGLKMKLEVLTKESDGSPSNREEINRVKTRLTELKSKFEELKLERIKVGEQIEQGDARIDILDVELKESRQQRRMLASEAFQAIGDGNKEISTLRAETALIDTKMRHLYAEIGRYVSRNSNRDPDCAKAADSMHGLVDVMRAMRRSIALNHRLAGTA
jgi:chromosome segregation ATPase